MKKGLIFIVLTGMLYWGYFYAKKFSSQEPIITGEEISMPIQKAEEILRRANLNIIEKVIEIFKYSEGRFPEELNELVEKGYLVKIPDFGDKQWEYNKQDGSVK